MILAPIDVGNRPGSARAISTAKVVTSGGTNCIIVPDENGNTPQEKVIRLARLLAGPDASMYARDLGEVLTACGQDIPLDALVRMGTLEQLIELLSAEDPQGWKPAARCLLLVLQNEEGRAAFHKVEAVGMLLGMLGSKRGDGAVERVMRVLLALVADTEGRSLGLLPGGALEAIVATLKGGRGKSNCRLAVQLVTCAANAADANKVAVRAAGGVEPLVALLGASCVLQDNSLMAAAATAVQAVCTGCQENVDAASAAGAVPLFVTLLRLPVGDPLGITAAEVLRMIARTGPEAQAEVVRAGAVAPLLGMLRADQRTGLASLEAVQVAAGLLAHLGQGQELKAEMETNNAALVLSQLEESEEPGIASSARTVLRNLGNSEAGPASPEAPATPLRDGAPECGAASSSSPSQAASAAKECTPGPVCSGVARPQSAAHGPQSAERVAAFRRRFGGMLASVKDSFSRSLEPPSRPPTASSSSSSRKEGAGFTPGPPSLSSPGKSSRAHELEEEDFQKALAKAMADSVNETDGGELGDDIARVLELSKEQTEGGELGDDIARVLELSREQTEGGEDLEEALRRSKEEAKGGEGEARLFVGENPLTPPGPLDAANLIFGGALGLSPVSLGGGGMGAVC